MFVIKNLFSYFWSTKNEDIVINTQNSPEVLKNEESIVPSVPVQENVSNANVSNVSNVQLNNEVIIIPNNEIDKPNHIIYEKPGDIVIDKNYFEYVSKCNRTVPHFDPNSIYNFSNILIIGPRMSGKTKLIKHFINYINSNNTIILSSIPGCTEYEDIKKSTQNANLLLSTLNSMDLDTFISNIKRNYNHHDSLVVFDDYFHKNQHSKDINWLACNHRCVKTSLIFSIQSLHGFPNSYHPDYIVVLRDTNKFDRRKLYELIGNNMRMDDFNFIMDKYTADYGCIIKDCRQSKLYHYKAY